jgi:transcriptional regulator with XRE-family HTH domain
MQKTAERFLAEALDAHIRGREYGVTRLARQLGVTPRTIDRWCAGEVEPSGGDVVRILAAIFATEPRRAIALAASLLPANQAAALQLGAVLSESCDVVEAAADLQHVVRDATQDGEVTPVEHAAIRNAALRVQRETADVPATLAAVPSPQTAFAEVAP